MTDGFKDKVAKFLTIALLVVIVAGGLFALAPLYQNEGSLKRKDAELSRRIEEKKREIARLVDYQKRFRTDPEFVETIARQNRRVYPGELVFVFDD